MRSLDESAGHPVVEISAVRLSGTRLRLSGSTTLGALQCTVNGREARRIEIEDSSGEWGITVDLESLPASVCIGPESSEVDKRVDLIVGVDSVTQAV